MEVRLFNKGQVSLITDINSLPAPNEGAGNMPDCDFMWIDSGIEELSNVVELLDKLTQVKLHEQHISDCLNPSHPAFFDSMQDYDLLIFRTLTKQSSADLSLETVPITFIILNKLFVTLSHTAGVIDDMKQKISDPRRAHPKQMNILLYQLLSSMIDQYLLLRDPLNEQYHYWQARLLDEKSAFKGWHHLLEYKTNIQRLYITCEQQLDAINQWRQAIDNEINESFDVKLTDLADHIRRVLRFSYQLERQLESLMQLHYSLISTRTNEIMRILTIISCIFMPLTLITGIFGMNFSFMPMIELKHGFTFTIESMLVVVVSLLALFRWRKWL